MTNGQKMWLAAVTLATASPLAAQGPAEVRVRDALQRIERLDRDVNSVLAVNPDAVAQARAVDTRPGGGPLAGQPILIKDNIEVAGMPTTAGSLALVANDTRRDAPIVTRLRSAGLVVVGKANLSEWANIRSGNSISGWSAVGGQTRNPHALDRNPCGSSSGSGAAVAAGIVRLAIGTETDGSITCPAAINGIVGFKPTVGLVSRTHIIPISVSQDTAGPMTLTVREAAELLTVIAGSDPADRATREADRRRVNYAAALKPNALRGTRVGVMRFADGFGTDAPFEAALALLKAQGATLVDIAKFDDAGIGSNEFTVLLTEFKDGLNDYLKSSPAPIPVRSLADVIAFNRATPRELALFDQGNFDQAEKTKGIKDPAYLAARAKSLRLAGAQGIDRLMRENRVVALVGPTMPPAWKIDAVNGDQISGGGAGSLAAVAGYPHLTVPMGQVKGLPVGLSFLGAKWSDATILSLGNAYEMARGPLPGARFLPAIEQAPEIAPLLAKPVRR
ncbi:amidase [Sphingomonas sp. LY29]|uniref:amidase n=1 Tax=Sphingomonas sp. LY29 TaxID=3095341 RepID=UPI002D78A405|nr:amidase [Sphingomonas sp. LY29]WRP25021.1 amidase [Sphingomonas sp. LY29]